MSAWAEGFDVAWAHMRRAGSSWSNPAERLRQARGLVDGVLAAAPWGDDQYGRQFAADLTPRLDGLAEGCERGARNMDDLEEQVDTAARTYQRVDPPYLQV
ncbi:type VII secretion target [Nonomuraea rhodomycinica]|uniref:Excreted virulence factor EspC, type VII ESX diderm n=1 Tax=Nonomuraea rhodomycinica TaxID=1712872 RepID=A0A7Y6J0R0_9ACTN|nr:type VII secretion target [Nonomuraea rhodomycinica]NUW46584.1 hypothetical protein [Nonomuraea rhodomycinica]